MIILHQSDLSSRAYLVKRRYCLDFNEMHLKLNESDWNKVLLKYVKHQLADTVTVLLAGITSVLEVAGLLMYFFDGSTPMDLN